jgi:poly(3-hydroxybutyrate) depolymerase
MMQDAPERRRRSKAWGRRRLVRLSALLVAGVLCLAGLGAMGTRTTPPMPAEPGPLPAIGAALDQTSVSGISSGAYMAGQMQIAHSRMIVGAGIVAGGPYGCAQSSFSRLLPIWSTALPHNLQLALNACMDDNLAFTGWPDTAELWRRAKALADDGRIDPLSGLDNQRVYIFHAAGDETVKRSVTTAAARFFAEAGLARTAVDFIRSERGAHAFITADSGLACGQTGPPYLNACDYDQAGAILQHIYGELAEPGAAPDMILFDQRIYTSGLDRHGMADTGAAFIPDACRNAPDCRVHVVFHGCQQSMEAVGESFVTGSGFASWAATNRLVVVFPQIRKTTFNPLGCWDWWGYSGLNYAETSAPQITAVRRMIEALAG